jgi:ubiquinone/menaquinone biosynthesis C-methylase UbiE
VLEKPQIMKQKEIFLQSEGDEWFARNQGRVAARKLPDDDPILRKVLELPAVGGRLKVLEIGCGDGTRLAWLKANRDADCYGIDPSGQAVAAARAKGVNATQGVADELPFESQSFDIIIFGFCLYLCDREDLFRIANEADRVLRTPGWLMIIDFYSPIPRARAYHHRPGVQSYKMDYRALFEWHPDYTTMTHEVRYHGTASYTDDSEEWVAVSVLRKYRETLGA